MRGYGGRPADTCWCAGTAISPEALAAVPADSIGKRCPVPGAPPAKEHPMKGNIAHGAGYLGRGASMLKHPSLRLFIFIPCW